MQRSCYPLPAAAAQPAVDEGRGAAPGRRRRCGTCSRRAGWTTIVAPTPTWPGHDRPPSMSPQTDPARPAAARAWRADPDGRVRLLDPLRNHPQGRRGGSAQPMVHAAAANRPAARARVHGPRAKGALGPPRSPGYPVTGSGSPTPMDIQDRTRGSEPRTGQPTTMDIRILARSAARSHTPEVMAYQ